MKRIIIFAAIVLLTLIAIMLLPKKRVVEEDYFKKASLTQGHYFSRIKEVKGSPKEEKTVKLEDGYYIDLIYDGYVYSSEFYDYGEATDTDYLIRWVTITDLSYRIGSNNVGIGSTRKKIERAYKSAIRITDLKNENDIGFVDGDVWVIFTFSADDTVSQIQIYYGP